MSSNLQISPSIMSCHDGSFKFNESEEDKSSYELKVSFNKIHKQFLNFSQKYFYSIF